MLYENEFLSYIEEGNKYSVTLEQIFIMQERARKLLDKDDKTELKKDLEAKFGYKTNGIIRGVQNLLDELECDGITEFNIKNPNFEYLFTKILNEIN